MAKEALQRIKNKSISIASGKGGVGKTTTSVNLGLYFSRKGLKTALIDLDPLSDIATMLDIEESESIVTRKNNGLDSVNFSDYRCPVFPSMDLLFPQSKLNNNDSAQLHQLIFNTFAKNIAENYDIIIFDMPAGTDFNENISYLPYIGYLLMVTNSEPTAHVAAGAYIKEVRNREPEKPIYLWNNRYSALTEGDFNPADLVGNYNKNVDLSDQLSKKAAENITNVAYIPVDPTLDLLQSNPSPLLHCKRSLMDKVRYIENLQIGQYVKTLNISSPKLIDMIEFFLQTSSLEESTGNITNLLAEYLSNIFGRSFATKTALEVFTPNQKKSFTLIIEDIKKDPIVNLCRNLREILDRSIEAEVGNRLFKQSVPVNYDKIVDKKILQLLIKIDKLETLSRDAKKVCSLLLFDFSLYKLLQAKTVVSLIEQFIPQKKNAQGRKVRDKYSQIRYLVEDSLSYRKKYFQLIKTLYPVVSRQLMQIVETFHFEKFLLRDQQNAIIKKAYLSLFSDFIHNCVYSGLGVVIGFRYRPASIAFQKSAETILSSIDNSNTESTKNNPTELPITG